MRLWLDDERPMPDGYTHQAYTAKEAIDLLETGKVECISLDHYLGENNGTGYEVACFIERSAFEGTLQSMRLKVHSQDPVGKQKIKIALQNAKRAWMEKKL